MTPASKDFPSTNPFSYLATDFAPYSESRYFIEGMTFGFGRYRCAETDSRNVHFNGPQGACLMTPSCDRHPPCGPRHRL